MMGKYLRGVCVFLCVCISNWAIGHKFLRRFAYDENDILSRYPGQDDYIRPTTNVVGVAGQDASLPCDLSSSFINDPAILVLWYKNRVIKPIYSYDTRNGPPVRWASLVHLGKRAFFSPKRGELVIHKLEADDEAMYNCRVDFKENPTLSYAVNLSIIIPPSSVYIETSSSSTRTGSSIVGPYQEGDTLRLTCHAKGGDPSPHVTWWDGPSLLDDQAEVTTSQQVSNILVIERLTREDLSRTLTCRAGNTNLSAPIEAKVSIDMIFAPRIVRILSAREPLSIGRSYEVTCQASGSKPAAEITWRLDSTPLTAFTTQTSSGGNITRSTLEITPTSDDNGRDLQCIGTSPSLKRIPVIDTWALNVFFPPQVRIRPGRSLNMDEIEENDDIYFECEIRANPPVYKIVWFHQDIELHHNVSRGIIISNQSLVLQHVHRSFSGIYSCKASNIEGDGTSDTLELTVKFAPVCQDQIVSFHGAAPNEEVEIPCVVEAHPPPNSFIWTFNNSGESVDIGDERIDMNGFESTVNYTPRTELDYGTLLCRARNTVGRQQTPCIFHVFPAGRPDPVHNCSQFNFSDTSINLRCFPGFDGGLPQQFIFQLYTPMKRLISNVSSSHPNFSIDAMTSSTSFDASVIAFNPKGRAKPYFMKVYTLKDNAEKRTAAIKPAPSSRNDIFGTFLTPILAISLGVAIGLVFVVMIILLVLKCRQSRDPLTSRDSMKNESLSCDKRKASSTQALIKSSTLSCENDDSNPDIIPRNGDSELSWKDQPTIAAITSPVKADYDRKTQTSPLSKEFSEDFTYPPATTSHPRKKGKDSQFADCTLPRTNISETSGYPSDFSVPRSSSTFADTSWDCKSIMRDPYHRDPCGPWGYNTYSNKARITREKDTIEPLLKSQRESSV